ncbi:hypothetical protein ACK35S_13140, partial [Aeromonas veronii]
TVMDAMKLSVSKEFIISTQPIGCITNYHLTPTLSVSFIGSHCCSPLNTVLQPAPCFQQVTAGILTLRFCQGGSDVITRDCDCPA